ncbi:hypothetical protein VB10N_43010 [Vibrio sp. 10N]|nr:hypothetical protein VB10N_43010 [Vibrio sp. 10N]
MFMLPPPIKHFYFPGYRSFKTTIHTKPPRQEKSDTRSTIQPPENHLRLLTAKDLGDNELHSNQTVSQCSRYLVFS